VTGLSPGFTTANASGTVAICYGNTLHWENLSLSVPVTVGPLIIGFTPSPLVVGTSGTLSITGAGFSAFSGAPTVQFDGTGIAVSGASVINDGNVFAGYVVSASAPAGTQNVSVSFPSNDGGATEQSNPWAVPVETPSCPASLTSVTLVQTTPKSLPDYNRPTWLTGVGILSTMQVGPTGNSYIGAVLYETVTPTTNSCPANIQQYTSFPTITLADDSDFTPGSSAFWEGTNFPSITNDFYDMHVNLVSANVLGLTSVSSCVAQAVQTYTCGGHTVGTFTLTNTYTKGTLNGQAVTNVTTTKR
jgi:hypothetical protein